MRIKKWPGRLYWLIYFRSSVWAVGFAPPASR
jgi:hypothetical protein